MLDWFRRKKGIGWLEADLRRDRRPAPEPLRKGVEEELALPKDAPPGPRYGLCAIAAALLEDLDLWRRIVRNESDRDYFYYRRQKDSGVSEDDLGRFPSFSVSTQRVFEEAATILSAGKVAGAAELRSRLETFVKAGE